MEMDSDDTRLPDTIGGGGKHHATRINNVLTYQHIYSIIN